MLNNLIVLRKILGSLVIFTVSPLHASGNEIRFENRKADSEPKEIGYTDEVGHCLRDGGGVSSCLAAGALVFLEAAAQKKNFAITDDLELLDNNVEPQETRTNFPLPIGENGEITDFNTLMEASSKFLQKRTLHWGLDFVYPGLQLCVGPTANSGPPMLQFLLDPRQSADERRLSTSRLLVKRAILPYILGMKLNLVTIMPLVFAALIVLTKKAFLLSKFAFLFMAMMGFSTASHLQQQHQILNPVQSFGYSGGGFDSLYVRDSDRMSNNRGDRMGRNFVWEEKEKRTHNKEEREKKTI